MTQVTLTFRHLTADRMGLLLRLIKPITLDFDCVTMVEHEPTGIIELEENTNGPAD